MIEITKERDDKNGRNNNGNRRIELKNKVGKVEVAEVIGEERKL